MIIKVNDVEFPVLRMQPENEAESFQMDAIIKKIKALGCAFVETHTEPHEFKNFVIKLDYQGDDEESL